MTTTRTAMLNQKGGVAKTTTTMHLGGTLAAAGKRVLLVDLDPQGNLTTGLGMSRLNPTDELTLTQAMLKDTGLEEARNLIRQHSENLWVIPSALDMFTLARHLYGTRSKEHRLEWVLEHFDEDFDHIIVDCRPALEIDTDNVIVWAKDALVPMDVDTFAIEALKLFLGQTATLTKETRTTPPLYRGIVLNRVARPFSTFTQGVYEAIHALSLPVVGEIPMRTAVTESKHKGQTIAQYAPKSDVAEMFRDLAVKSGLLTDVEVSA
ncbi:ParA family protein [Streptomyces flavofungini]|uniref:ParA family protein n=1 Tax=Streptomyces flavofungini TaxID=68200 RepID=UPI0025B215DA|nr:ParA family protein [Streptomyces flavofungini]WJV51822.1 ParA family protein [Streptomyces flavofungini]WJV51829.1 ParA family protein [Streptomyces flavofungini]